MESHDAIIVGGGLAGLSLASALRHTPVRIALIDAAPLNEPGRAADDRSLALSPASQRVLAGIGVWDAITGHATPVLGIHVSECGRFGALRLRAEDLGLSALAHVMPARMLHAALAHSVRESRCELINPASVTEIRVRPGGVEIRVQEGDAARRLSASVLIAADGAQSRSRAMLGVRAREHDYRQTAIIAAVTSGKPHQHVAYERFSPAGPVALLPQPAVNRCGLVFVVPVEQAAAVMESPAEQFLAQVQGRFGGRLGELSALASRSAYPLRRIAAERIAGGRYVIIGNAAHTMHPNAAQGLNLGLRDVAVLAELLHDAAAARTDIGASAVTEAYVRKRLADQRRTLRLADSLARLFYSNRLSRRLLRGAGIVTVDLIPALKRALIRTAGGLQGPVPRLVQGMTL